MSRRIVLRWWTMIEEAWKWRDDMWVFEREGIWYALPHEASASNLFSSKSKGDKDDYMPAS